MLFNSIEYAVFFPIVFFLYWIVGSKKDYKIQNFILFIASYFFYANWDFRFLFLLFFSTSLDFISGLKIHRAQTKLEKKTWFWLSVIINLGFLAVFKYYNFFVNSFSELLQSFGLQVTYPVLQIILPVGISFYTFHGLSYIIDVYNDKINPEHNFIDYAVFVSFFPLLVAGPIERATHLLPQLKKRRNFHYVNGVDGVQQILWGLFKKTVVADNCASIVDVIFDSYKSFDSFTLFLGAILFAIQIYGDFSGYSDIAIGSSKLLGINLIRNFNYPYFSRDIAEFWRRWHISLTTWFRDYIYIPLGGSRVSKILNVRNVFVIFLISGFWHGANWTFLVWGAYHAVLFLPLLIARRNRKYIDVVASNQIFPNPSDFVKMLVTFVFVVIGWVLFRSETLTDAFIYLKRMLFDFDFHNGLSFVFNNKTGLSSFTMFFAIVFSVVMFFVEWINRKRRYGLELKTTNLYLRLLILAFFVFAIYFCHGDPAAFIYFQF